MSDTINDLPQLRVWLADAQLAQHNLLTGQQTISVSYDGKASVTYGDRNQLGAMDQLAAYISSLKARIAALEGDPLTKPRPIHMTF